MKTTLTRKNVVCLNLILACLAGGCAQLDVKVSILDKDKLKQSSGWLLATLEGRDAEAAKALARDSDGKDKFSTSANDIAKGISAELTTLDAAVSKIYESSAVGEFVPKKFADVAPAFIDIQFDDVRNAYSDARKAYANALKVADSAKGMELAQAAARSFDNADELARAAPAKVSKVISQELDKLKELVKDYSPKGDNSKVVEQKQEVTKAAASVTTKTNQESEKTLNSIVGQNGLFDEPLASRVVSVGESYWKGTYNKAFGNGFMGSTDIAVKMQDLADFTLKGVRVDSTKITQATFKGVTAAVKIAAAVYGVPTPGGTGTSNASAASTDALRNADQGRADADAKLRRARGAAFAMLSTLTEQHDAATKKPAVPAPDQATQDAIANGRKTALAIIKSAIGANKADLVPSP